MTRFWVKILGIFAAVLPVTGCGLMVLVGGSIGTDNPSVSEGVGSDAMVSVEVPASTVASDSVLVELRYREQDPWTSPEALDSIMTTPGANVSFSKSLVRDGQPWCINAYKQGSLISQLCPDSLDASSNNLVLSVRPMDSGSKDSVAGDSLVTSLPDYAMPDKSELPLGSVYAYVQGSSLAWKVDSWPDRWYAHLPTGTYVICFDDVNFSPLGCKSILIQD